MPSRDDSAHQRTLLDIHRRNLGHYLQQKGWHGSGYLPLAVRNGIAEEQQNIARIKSILRGWGETIDDHPDDGQSIDSTAAASSASNTPSFIFNGPITSGITNIGSTTSIEELRIPMGDSFNFTGANLSGSNNNFKSTLTNVTQTVGALPASVPADKKEHLAALLKQLGELLGTAPADKQEDAETVEEYAKELLSKLGSEQPKKTAVTITLDGLKKAAENLGAVIPAILPLATQIANHVMTMFK